MKAFGMSSLIAAVVLAMVHGLAYVHLTPPWQHYDEPAHFEYAWLTANIGRLPQPEDANRQLRGDLIRSMAANGFFNPPLSIEELNRAANPEGALPNIGYSQLGDDSVYYLVPAAAIRLTSTQSLGEQLLAARLSSVVLLVFTIISSWAIARLLFPHKHPVRTLLPISLALLPSFVELMTSVNSDVGAVTAYSFFLWAATRYLTLANPTRPQRIAATLWMASSAVLCVFVKGTSVGAVIVAMLAFVFGHASPRRRRIGWLLLIPSAVLIPLFMLRGGDAQAWYLTNHSARTGITRCGPPLCANAPVGKFAIRVAPRTGESGRLIQPVPKNLADTTAGRIVTVSGWRWTPTPGLTLRMPWLVANYTDLNSPEAPLSQTPSLFAYTVTVPAKVSYLYVVLPGVAASSVYYDGLIATAGEWSITDLQQAAHKAGSPLILDNGAKLVNVLRNGSGEVQTLAFRISVLWVLDRVTPAWMEWPTGLSALLDLQGSGWYFQLVLQNIFESFWGRFGWGQIALPSEIFTAVFALTIICSAAAGTVLLQKRNIHHLALGLVFGIAVLGSIVPAALRGTTSVFEYGMWLAGARYIAPVTILLMLILLQGSCTLLRRFGPVVQRIVPTILLGELSVLALTTVGTYYAVITKSQSGEAILEFLRTLSVQIPVR